MATAVNAQLAFPTATIVGAGGSSTANSLRFAADCYGRKQALGFGTTFYSLPARLLPDFDFNPPAVDTLANRFNCSGDAAAALVAAPNFGVPRIGQPNIALRYLSLGSGDGRSAFLNNRVASTIAPSFGFPTYLESDGYQFSLTETPLRSSDLTRYNTASISPFNRYPPFGRTAVDLFGPAIQIPVAILPIAIAFSPVYAKRRAADGNVTSYRFAIGNARADGSGGLRLTRAQYCGIFNGTITNWNQLPATVVAKDPADPWTFDVPIRLVGRSDAAGTSSIFTRALSAQCTGLSVNTGFGGAAPVTPITNKFGNSEERLPYDGVTTVVGTAYTGAAGFNSPTNSISGAFFNKAVREVTIGTEYPGLFTVANGDDGVALATGYHPDPSAAVGDVTFNGRIAYLSPEQTLPATLFNTANALALNTASLQINGSGFIYAAPAGADATRAFGTVQPPQSKGTAGAYCTDAAVCPSKYGDRANPLDWLASADKSVFVAAPTKGYPIIGTSNALLYTCYATPERRQAVNSMFALLLGKVSKDYNNQALTTNLVVDPVYGTFASNGLAPLPLAWRTAISETFLKSSTQLGKTGDLSTKLGLRNLWIQDRIPSAPTGTTSITAGNPLCAGKPGA